MPFAVRGLVVFALVILCLGSAGCSVRNTGRESSTSTNNISQPVTPASFSPQELQKIKSAIEEGDDDLSLIAITTPTTRSTTLEKIAAAGGRIDYDAADPEVGYDGGFLVFSIRPSKAVSLVKELSLKSVSIDRKFSVDPQTRSNANPIRSELQTLERGKPNPFLPVHETRALEFRNQNRESGSLATVAVLDTGIASDHDGIAGSVVDWKNETNEGVLSLSPATLRHQGDKTYIDSRVGKLDVTDISEGASSFHVGIFDEEKLNTSSNMAGDLNRNGTNTDKIAVVTFQKKKPNGESEWFGAIDANLDHAISTNEATADFKIGRAAIALGGATSEFGSSEVTFDISNNGKQLSLGFDGDDHGTHLAGIIAGHGLVGGRLDGVAPEAKLMAVKVLNSVDTGTSSMSLRGMIYAATHGADIINLSLGMNQEAKGGEDPQSVLIRDLSERYGTLFSIAAGNEGPGLNSLASPGDAPSAITSGAYVSTETYASNYGVSGIPSGIATYSSVGPTIFGALKPTIVAPGSALSAVPRYRRSYEAYNGTSMATAQTSGALALLISKAKKDKLALVLDPSKRKFLSSAMKKAVTASAKFLNDYSSLEQGYGLLDVVAAYEELKKINSEVKKGAAVFDYESKSFAGYRSIGQLPQEQSLSFTRMPIRGVNFESSPHSLELRANPTYIDGARSEASPLSSLKPSRFSAANKMTFDYKANYDWSGSQKPGIYSTRIDAYNPETGWLETSMLATAILPYYFTPEGTRPYSHYFKQVSVQGGRLKRYFFMVPENASVLSLKLHVPEGVPGKACLYVSDPTGVSHMDGSLCASREDNETFSDAASHLNRLRPGIWEVDVSGSILFPYSAFDLRVSLSAVKFEPNKLAFGPTGGSATISVQNNFWSGATDASEFKNTSRGIVYRSQETVKMGYEQFRPIDIPASLLMPNAKSVIFRASVTNHRFSDDSISINLYDERKRPLNDAEFILGDDSYGQTTILKAHLKPGRYFVSLSGTFTANGETTVDYEERIETDIGKVTIQPTGSNGALETYFVEVTPKVIVPSGFGIFLYLVLMS
jgi:hypothetical protein